MAPESSPGAEELGSALKSLSDLIETSGHTLLPNFGDSLLQSIVDAAGQLFGAAAASIALVDFEGEMLEFKVSYGEGNDEIVGRRFPLDSGIAGYVVMTGQPIAIADVQQDPRFNQDFAKSTGYVPKSILATPLEWQDRVIGVMEVLDKIEAPRFDLHDMEMLGLFAQQASIAIAQSQHYDQIAGTLLQAIGSWAQGGDESELGAILESMPDGKQESKDMRQLTLALGALLQAGAKERAMTLEILAAIQSYLDDRSSRMSV